jgi:tetratricopeptide (TPR) repeat protein
MPLPGTATQLERTQQERSPGRCFLVVAGLVLLSCAAACADSMKECEARFRAKEYEQAAGACTRAHREQGLPGAAARAAGAAYELGRGDEVRAWAERLRGQPGEAEVLFYAGLVQNKAGDREAAIATHRRALALAEERDEPRATTRNAYALYLQAGQRGRTAEALAWAYESFAAAQRSGERDRQTKAMEAIGLALFDLGDLDGARLAQEQVRSIADPGDRILQARLAQQEGVLYEAENRLSLARDAFDRSFELAEATGNERLQRDNHINLATVAISLGDNQAAREHLTTLEREHPKFAALSGSLYAGRLARQEGRLEDAARHLDNGRARSKSPDWLWEIELEAGQVAELRGDTAAAEAAYERAVGHIEAMRSDLESNDLKAWTLARKRRPYEALFILRARHGRAQDALAVLEQARARSLLDAIIASTLTSDLAGAGSAPGAGAERGDLTSWMRRATERAGAIESLLPVMSVAPVAQPRPVDEVVRGLGTRTALVYFHTADGLWLLRVGGGSVVPRELATGEALRALEAQVDALARAPGEVTAATALGHALLPAALLPEPGVPLYVVADGPLLRLPFAALRLDGQYLVERHALIHVPSLGALAAIESREQSAAGPPAALGDPRGDLPEAAREIAHVAEKLGVQGALGPAATRAALQSTAGARVLHLATHVEVGPRGASLILADGEVTAGEIVEGRLGPGLAVLAGCASAAQLAHRHGREVWGSLAAAFLASGARQVVAALWSIPDRSTRAFVERFYAEGGAEDPASALARAQRAWIADGRAAEEWAPFVLLGTGTPAERSP